MKNETKQKAEVKQEVKAAQFVPDMRYRYVCHGCTNDALTSSNQMVGITVTCMHCGMIQVTKAENWLSL